MFESQLSVTGLCAQRASLPGGRWPSPSAPAILGSSRSRALELSTNREQKQATKRSGQQQFEKSQHTAPRVTWNITEFALEARNRERGHQAVENHAPKTGWMLDSLMT